MTFLLCGLKKPMDGIFQQPDRRTTRKSLSRPSLGDAPGRADVLPVRAAPKPPSERASLSITRLNRAREILFLVTGEDKRTALAVWRRGADIPAAQVVAPQVRVLLAAAADKPD